MVLQSSWKTGPWFNSTESHGFHGALFITKLQHRSVVGLAEHFHLEDSRMGENFSPRGPQIYSLDSEIIGVPNFDTHLMPLEFIIDWRTTPQPDKSKTTVQRNDMFCFCQKFRMFWNFKTLNKQLQEWAVNRCNHHEWSNQFKWQYILPSEMGSAHCP